jgi:hypothetical protein
VVNNALKKGIISDLELDSETKNRMKDLLIAYSISKIARKESFMKTKFRPLNEVKSIV